MGHLIKGEDGKPHRNPDIGAHIKGAVIGYVHDCSAEQPDEAEP